MAVTLIAFASLLPSAAFALNDWSVPCLQGQCSYDLTAGGASGSVTISGSSNAISDITAAAGWTILDCTPDTGAQDIRLVCTGDAASCAHLDQGSTVGTLVRLPDTCGTMPFARVAKTWVHQNQTIPADIASTSKRDGNTNPVRGLALDTNFAAVDPAQNGDVDLLIQGTSIDGLTNATTIDPPAARGLSERGLSDLVPTILKGFNVTLNTSKKPVTFDQKFNVFQDSISCPASGAIPAINAGVSMDVEAKANFGVDYGFAAVGKVIPPKLTDFGLFADFDGSLNGILNVNANAGATFDTGRKTVFSFGLPGLDFDGFLKIGPTFNLDLQGLARLDINANLAVDLAYTVQGGRMFFPPNQGASSGIFAPADTNIALSASPDIKSQASLEAHIIPNLEFGITAFSAVDANVHLDFDASGKLALSLEAGASASTNGTKSRQFGGCADVSSTLAVNAGADASFLSIFDKSASVTLFSKTFDLFKKCFGDAPARRTIPDYNRRHARDVMRRGLTCPTSTASLASIVGEAISASSITALSE